MGSNNYTDIDGVQHWWINNQRHREDGPAVIYPDGTQLWFRYGRLHREDGPAVIHPDNEREWWFDGILHQEDGPAVIYSDGTQEYLVTSTDVVIVTKVDNTIGWVAQSITNLGAVRTAVVPD